MSLYTVEEIHSNNWMELPIYNDVIKMVEEQAEKKKNPTFDQYPMFEWSPGITIMEYMTEN